MLHLQFGHKIDTHTCVPRRNIFSHLGEARVLSRLELCNTLYVGVSSDIACRNGRKTTIIRISARHHNERPYAPNLLTSVRSAKWNQSSHVEQRMTSLTGGWKLTWTLKHGWHVSQRVRDEKTMKRGLGQRDRTDILYIEWIKREDVT